MKRIDVYNLANKIKGPDVSTDFIINMSKKPVHLYVARQALESINNEIDPRYLNSLITAWSYHRIQYKKLDQL